MLNILIHPLLQFDLKTKLKPTSKQVKQVKLMKSLQNY